jgi:subtilase family serine protease
MTLIPRTAALAWLAFALIASVFSFICPANAESHPTMTTHVPDVVTRGQAVRIGHLDAAQRLSLAISLPLRSEPRLLDFLQRLYDPQSPSYRHYLNVKQFTENYGPTQEDYTALIHFARANGFTVIDQPANRMLLDVEAAAATIESTFHITLGVYQHPTENRTFYAPDREPTLDLDVPVLHISGLDDFSLPVSKYIEGSSKNTITGSGPGGSYLGSDLRAAYYGSGPLNGAGQSVALYEGQGFELSDIQTYFANANEPLNVPIVAISVNGASVICAVPCNDSEPALDIEQVISMAPGLSQLQVYVGKRDTSIFNEIAANDSSMTISCSDGWADNESSLDPIFEEMAAQGQTVFVATGDQGSNTAANIVWPADDPWVTAVGGTILYTNGAGGSWKSEIGWPKSTGMASPNGVPIPSYQLLAGVITSSNGASTTLRNIPDLAAESDTVQYICAIATCAVHGGGTSYAAPLWAGLMALVNEQSLSNGGTYMGFFNPTLYNIGVGTNFTTNMDDITSGSNGAYTAVTGYDLVTGWGSPNAVNLINSLAPPQ